MPDLENLKSLFPVFEDSEIDCGPGWYDLLLDLGIDLSLYAQRTDIETSVDSVKTVNGTLRYQLLFVIEREPFRSQLQAIASEYFARSKTVCERCGRKGRRVFARTGTFTLCLDCHRPQT